MAFSNSALILGISCIVFQFVHSVPTNYNVGVGIADITGPAADVDLIGYMKPEQTAHGIHIRQFSRAFIIVDPDTQKGVVYVVTDTFMASQIVKLEVIKELKKMYGSLYTERNVCISATNTHSGPGGYSQYLMSDITAFGFVNETFIEHVHGIVLSIKRAHDNIQPANIYVNQGVVSNSSINRSPTAYMNNPEEERKKYSDDVDRTMTILKFVDAQNSPIGMLSWFGVHGTSMNNNNDLISGDNKGYASLLFERHMNNSARPGKGNFVAAFAQGSDGDVSPNTAGAHCLDTGKPCDNINSTCHGKYEMCVATGPGIDMFDSTAIIGANQYKTALKLFNGATEPLSGPVAFRHSYTDMSQQVVSLKDNKTTCKPALGYSFASGTTDGPGVFDFTQGTHSTSPVWNRVRDLIHAPSKQQVECHHPKPILLDTGERKLPYAWQPTIVDTQIFSVGRVIIIAVPGEFSTMAGRRLQEAVGSTLTNSGFPDPPLTVIAGLANDYVNYVTTFEEYQVQRYEGASTLYGPYTLEAFIKVYSTLSTALAKNDAVVLGPNPPYLLSVQLGFLPSVKIDKEGLKDGDLMISPLQKYKPGETVSVAFHGANPRTRTRDEKTFLQVLLWENNGTHPVLEYTDADWETRFIWSRFLEKDNRVTLEWDIPADQKPGSYYIYYYGDYIDRTGTVKHCFGATQNFVVG